MKRKTNIFLSFIFALAAVLGLTFSTIGSTLTASADVVNITFSVDANTSMDAADKTAQTNADGTLASFPTAKKDGYHLLGWKIGEASTEAVPPETVFAGDTTLLPIWTAKTYVYTITKNADTTIKVVGQTATEGETYVLIKDAASLSTAISYINSDNVSTPIAPSTLVFKDYVLSADETVTLTKSVNISGNLTSSNELPIFTINPTANSVFNFSNLTLTNNSFGTLVAVNTTSAAHTLKFNTVSFETTVTNTCAIEIQPISTIALDGVISHTSTYLYQYHQDSTLDLSGQDIESPSKIKIAFGIELDGTVVATNVYPTAVDFVEFVPTSNLYTVEPEFPGTTLIINALLNVDYQTDGGNLSDSNKPNLFYLHSADTITLPDGTQTTKAYATFDGWFGSFTYSSTTYYFDITCLNNYLSNAGTLADLATYFKTDLSEFDISSSITEYQYMTPTTDSNAWAEFFVSNNTRPTLIAKWNYTEYTITFETNGGSTVAPLVEIQGATITSPTTTKEGYTFTGWFEDETLETQYTFVTMPAENFTLYAGWTINNYTLTFVKNNGETNATTTQIYGEEIAFPTIALEGHKLVGWFTEEALTNQFTQTTIPAESITLYAKWEKETYSIYLNLNGKGQMSPIKTLFGEVPTPPANPTFAGYTFHGWFEDIACTTPFNFEAATPARNRTAYAKWIVIQYRLTYVFNNGTANRVVTKDFDSAIEIPTQPSRNGYSFAGWHTDAECTTMFDFSTKMPASELTLYAKWTAKINITLTLDKQSAEIDSRGHYNVPSNISGFTVQYFVNNQWQIEAPTQMGTYKVMVFRAEDEQYAEFMQVVEDGFTVTQKTLDISWLPVALIVVFIIEMAMVVVIKLLRKKKLHQTIIIQTIVLPFGIIPKTQFILSAVTAVLAIFGFIYMIVELVKLHRTIPLKDEPDTKYDNRALLEKRGDKSEDASISSNVNELLKKEGFYFRDDYSKDDHYKVDDDIIGKADASYTGKITHKKDENED